MSLIELAERVEKATGPDRELDDAIAKALSLPIGPCWCTGACQPDNQAYQGACVAIPKLTGSLDAAMTLVPEGCLWHVTNTSVEQHFADLSRSTALVGYPDDTRDNTVEAATPALALVAAALRARAQQEQTI